MSSIIVKPSYKALIFYLQLDQYNNFLMIFKYVYKNSDYSILLSQNPIIMHQDIYLFNYYFHIYLPLSILFVQIPKYLTIYYQFYEIKTKIHTFFSSLLSFLTKIHVAFTIKFIINDVFLLRFFFFLKSIYINAVIIISFYVRDKQIKIKFIEILFSQVFYVIIFRSILQFLLKIFLLFLNLMFLIK